MFWHGGPYAALVWGARMGLAIVSPFALVQKLRVANVWKSSIRMGGMLRGPRKMRLTAGT